MQLLRASILHIVAEEIILNKLPIRLNQTENTRLCIVRLSLIVRYKSEVCESTGV